jgi:glucose-1-phosphate adenylyltransferase
VGSELERSVVGIRSRVAKGTRIRETLLLGADYYETLDEIARAGTQVPPIGVGEDTLIERAIVDKNARIGRGVRIVNEAGELHKDGDGWFIRDGIVVIPKHGVIPDGMVI